MIHFPDFAPCTSFAFEITDDAPLSDGWTEGRFWIRSLASWDGPATSISERYL